MTLVATSARSTDVDIQAFLQAEGFPADSLPRARTALEGAGLTRPGKRRLASNKLPGARDALRARLTRVCHRKGCRHVDDPRERIVVATASCEVCNGSPNRRAGVLARQALLAAGYRRLLVVGGTPTTHAALMESLGSDVLQIRWIDGTQPPRCSATVEADLDWADVMVIWATTPLPHTVSRPYTSRAPGRLPWITVARRGVEAMCDELGRFTGRAYAAAGGTQAAATSASRPHRANGR